MARARRQFLFYVSKSTNEPRRKKLGAKKKEENGFNCYFFILICMPFLSAVSFVSAALAVLIDGEPSAADAVDVFSARRLCGTVRFVSRQLFVLNLRSDRAIIMMENRRKSGVRGNGESERRAKERRREKVLVCDESAQCACSTSVSSGSDSGQSPAVAPAPPHIAHAIADPFHIGSLSPAEPTRFRTSLRFAVCRGANRET